MRIMSQDNAIFSFGSTGPVVDRLAPMWRPGETYSDVIIRLAVDSSRDADEIRG